MRPQIRRIALPVFLALSLVALPPSSAQAEETPDRDFDAQYADLLSQSTRTLQNQAAVLGAAQGLSVAGARHHLETLAVYRELSKKPVRVNWREIDMPVHPGPDVLAAVGKYNRLTRYDLRAVDAMIARDMAFLRQPHNNQGNATYVEARLAGLRALRAQVERGVMHEARDLADNGDSVMSAHSGSSFAELENRARAAEQALGKAANGPASDQFAKTLARRRDYERRNALRKRQESLPQALDELVSKIDDEGGTYQVVVLHIRSQRYGHTAPLAPGKRVSMTFRDTYSVAVNTSEKLAKSMARWRELYDYDWCRSMGVTGGVGRSSITFAVDRGGLSRGAANKLANLIRKAFGEQGLSYGTLGWSGPDHGVSVPFTVPANVMSIRQCGK